MFRFSIRDVLLVTVIVGLAVGWVADHVSLVSSDKAEAKWAARHETLVNGLRGYGWRVTWQELAVDPISGKGGDVLFLEPPPPAQESN